MELLIISALFLSTFFAGAYVGHRVTRRIAWEDFLATRDHKHEREREEWEKKCVDLDSKYAVERAAHKRTREAKDWYKAELRDAREKASDEAKRRAVGK